MDNRFGLKDIVVVVLLVAVGISIWLFMIQKDHQWKKLVEIESTLRRLQDRVESLAAAPRAAPARSTSEGSAAPTGWARPGTPIAWQPTPTFPTDPRGVPGFREGGEFTELLDAKTPRVTPFIATDVYGRRIIERVAEYLATFDPLTLELRGILADAWQYAADGTWLRVHLRPEATFSDGAPVRAADVLYTFKEYVLNPQIEAAAARSTLDSIADVTIIDEHTVEFTFNKVVFTNRRETLNQFVLPKHFYERFSPSQINQSTSLLMGSGPYRLATVDPANQWNPGDDLVLVRNEQYWLKSLRCPLDRLRFRTVNDEKSRLVAYRNGEGDMSTPTAPQFVEVKEEPGWAEANHSFNWINMRSGYSFIAWQCGKRRGERLTPFHDKRVRQAMTLLLDREQMIKDIWSGVGAVAKSPFNPASPSADASKRPWPYDVDAARKLLGEAGWLDRNGDGVLENEQGDPFEWELTIPVSGEITDRTVSFVKLACKKAGIRCVPKLIDWAVLQNLAKARDFDALMMGWQSNSPESDIRQMFHSESIKEGGDNFVQWSSPACDELLEKGRRMLDDAARMGIWHQVEAVLHEEQPYTFIRVQPWLRFIRKDFGNVHERKTGIEPWEFFRATSTSSPMPAS